MKTATAALLAAFSIFFSGCFQDEPASVQTAQNLPCTGIASIYRPSSLQAPNSVAEAAEPAAVRNQDYFLSGYPADFQSMEAPGAAEPGFSSRLSDAGKTMEARIDPGSTTAGHPVAAQFEQSVRDSAGILFDIPLRSLFSGLMHRSAGTEDEDLPNPFAEAGKKLASEKSQAAASKDPAPAENKETTASDAGPSDASPKVLVGASGNPEPPLLFVGDLDGSGVLTAAYATRTGDAEFAFEDGTRTFVIFNQRDAVASQRSLAVEDMNGDGSLDLLSTSRQGLFGAVLLGGDGDFRVADTFLTGYEPVVAVPGPMRDGWREILLVDWRSGLLTTFRSQGHYQAFQRDKLSFVPDFMAHLAKPETGADYFMAFRADQGAARLYEWLAGSSLAATGETLPALPGAPIEVNPQREVGLVQVYQVGSYASVVLADSMGNTFNVANIRVDPSVFLVFGDVEKYGTLDAGLALLK